MSAYRTAIDQTTAAVDRRARYFRNQVVIVVAIAALVIIGAFVWSAAALWAGLLLIPACGLYFHADSRLLNRWRSDLLQPWVARELDLVAYCQAIRANPILPKETTGAMLASLPLARDLISEQKMLTPTRQAIAAASLATHRGRADALLLKTIASGILVGAVVAALWMRALVPLIGLAALAVLPVVGIGLGRWRQARCEAEVAACRTRAGFNESDYTRFIGRMVAPTSAHRETP